MTAIKKKTGLTNAEALVKLIGLVSDSVWRSLKI
jgi:hypothetical protein